MTLNKINNFAETRDASEFAKGIKARMEGAALFAAPAPAQARTWRPVSVA